MIFCFAVECGQEARYRITRRHPRLTSTVDTCRRHLGQAVAMKVATPGGRGYHPDEPPVEVVYITEALIAAEELGGGGSS